MLPEPTWDLSEKSMTYTPTIDQSRTSETDPNIANGVLSCPRVNSTG